MRRRLERLVRRHAKVQRAVAALLQRQSRDHVVLHVTHWADAHRVSCVYGVKAHTDSTMSADAAGLEGQGDGAHVLPPIVAKLCDVVLNDLTQSQLPRLEVLLQQMGTQIYSANDDKRQGSTDFVPISGNPSPVLSDTASMHSNGEVRVTRALEYALAELVTTERNYVARLDALHSRYAVPLLQLAKDKDTEIIPLAEAECIFGNIGEILAANKVLLCELEVEYDQGPAQLASTVGSILARNIYTFGCYDTYLAGFERAQRTYNQMLKHRPLREFIMRTQHSMSELGNAGLRELMVEPMQRIPRYQLLIGNLIKHLPPTSPQIERLQDASAAATIIASRRVTDGERLVAVLWSCQRTINRFPPELVSAPRELLGCIDVDEVTADTVQSRAMQTLGTVLGRKPRSSYALLVFTDVLVLIQRHSSIPTHILLGLHEPDRLADQMRSAHISAPSNRRTDLLFAGMSSLHDIRVTGQGAELSIEMDRPMRGAPSKSAQLVRRFVDAMPDAHSTHIPLFLGCLWQAQAVFRARGHALAARKNITHSSRGPITLLWTLFTRSQYESFAYRDRLLVILGALDTPSRQDMSHASELFVNVELQDDADTCMIYMSRAWGSQARRVSTSLADVPRLCADLHVLSTLPPTAEPLPPAEPVRRTPSLRTDEKREVPRVHRARSLMSERVRASIQESLEVVQEESKQHEQAELQLGRKRHVPMADRSNEPPHTDSPKRRAVPSQAPGEENVVPVRVAGEAAEPMDERGTPIKRAPGISMYTDDTLDLPNPFDEGDAMPSASPVLPEPTKVERPPHSQEEHMVEEPLDEPPASVPRPPPKATPRKETISIPPSKTVTEDEMHEMLKPLLEHIQVAPAQQPVLVHAKPSQAARSAEVVMPEPLDVSIRATEDSSCALMKQAIESLNVRIATLRQKLPSSALPAQCADDWNAFKQAVKDVNATWTKMERAYENKQMDLASLRLAQPEHDTRVHLSQEEYADLQNQSNMVLPLQLQIEKLQKQCASLQELEKDTRLENAELYNVFNEELSKLYQHSFRPANEEIDMLRANLVSAKTQIHELRQENRLLRLHNTVGSGV